MRGLVLPIFGLLAGAACSGGSGVPSGKTLASLSSDEYVTVCKYFNAKSQSLVGQTCAATQVKVLRVLYVDCDRNPFAGTMCAATVSDVESCASRDVCAVLSPDVKEECKRVAMCAGGN
jgi:hypothetical protein